MIYDIKPVNARFHLWSKVLLFRKGNMCWRTVCYLSPNKAAPNSWFFFSGRTHGERSRYQPSLLMDEKTKLTGAHYVLIIIRYCSGGLGRTGCSREYLLYYFNVALIMPQEMVYGTVYTIDWVIWHVCLISDIIPSLHLWFNHWALPQQNGSCVSFFNICSVTW